MSTSGKLVLAQTINRGGVKFVNADGTTAKTVFTAGANGSNLKALIGHSSDSANRNIVVNIVSGGTTYPLGTVAVPLNSGNTGAIASVNLLTSTLIPGLPIDAMGQPYIPLKSGDTVTVAPLVAATAATTITVNSFGEDY